MSQQYGRKVSLIVGTTTGKGLDLSDLQFKFSIQRGNVQTPNTLSLRVYNVSEQTINLLQDPRIEFKPIVLQAGYEGNYGTLFSGTFKYVARGHETSIDSYIDITAGDGDVAYNNSVIATSVVAGSTPQEHIKAAADTMAPYGVTYDPKKLPLLGTNALPRGKVFFGMTRDFLRDVANTTGTDWSIQDGELQFTLQTSYAPGDIVILTSATGMIGFPEQTQNGIQIRSLINPFIKSGGRVQIDNKSVQQFHFNIGIAGEAEAALLSPGISLAEDGVYKVLYSEHLGDTRGNAFYTDITCIAVNASVPVSQIPKLSVQPYGPS